MEELDRILRKYTSDQEVPNALKGASFTAFTKDGIITFHHGHILAAFRIQALQLIGSLT